MGTKATLAAKERYALKPTSPRLAVGQRLDKM